MHEEPSLRFRYGDGGENVFYTDGRMTEDLEAGLLEARACWKKGKRIEIERDSPQGGAITEKYELSDDGSELFVQTKMEGNGRMPPQDQFPEGLRPHPQLPRGIGVLRTCQTPVYKTGLSMRSV